MKKVPLFYSRAGLWRGLPNKWDLVAFLLLFGVFALLGEGAHEMHGSFAALQASSISLNPVHLPAYALRTVMRMLAAMVASLLFTFLYATLAAKSRRAEMVLVPLLDILQSVPVLGYISFTVVFFLRLFPGNVLGAECASIFAVFTAQAWNMTFSFYQSLRTVPRDLDEVSRGFRFSAWQRFWRLEVPFAMPGLIWNAMMSMSGGWFFVVASEAITVGDETVVLPGVGSYVAEAIKQQDLHAIGWAILTMLLVILAYDQLLFRPLVAWSEKFRFEQTASGDTGKSWVLSLLKRTRQVHWLLAPLLLAQVFIARVAHALSMPQLPVRLHRQRIVTSRMLDMVWDMLVFAFVAYGGWKLFSYMSQHLEMPDVTQAVGLGLITLLRVVLLIGLTTLVWVPVGIWVGLRPNLAAKIQPMAQFLAAFPANLLFPLFVMLIVRYRLHPDIWLSPLMIFGTQWYILFNVIAGASAFPTDLRQVADNFQMRGWQWWRVVMLPGIFPYYVTGAITASGGSWNASIVSEMVSWGSTTVQAHGLGAYIAQATAQGDYPRIVLGITVMSVLVTFFNRLLWRKLYTFAEDRLRLE